MKKNKNLAQILFKRPLVDLGVKEKELSGIYSPLYKTSDINRYMTGYYSTIENVRHLADSFDITDYYYSLIERALKEKNYQKKGNLKILDLGCGFGSTTFPLLKLFPRAQIIATELALPMLIVLKEKLAGEKNVSRCELTQLNAEELDFKENSFDLIVGAAILHHLLNPDKTIRQCQKILKPGGLAIFFEPFEAGMHIFALIFQSILNHRNCLWWYELPKKRYMRDSLILWQKMKNLNKRDPFFRTVDDKWLFQKSYFEKLAQELSFTDLTIFRLDQSKQPYTHMANEHFDKNFAAFPDWIKDIFKQYEEWLSDEAKNELLTEGCVIYEK